MINGEEMKLLKGSGMIENVSFNEFVFLHPYVQIEKNLDCLTYKIREEPTLDTIYPITIIVLIICVFILPCVTVVCLRQAKQACSSFQQVERAGSRR